MRATDEAIERFCERLTEATNDAFERRGDTVNGARFEPDKGGRKYVRIVQVSLVHGNECSRSAHCFVKLDDGTLWKPDGWKGPAKNFPRGSVFDETIGPYAGR